ncbi:hypothetical protein LOK49_LG07G01685 [Camellia lanceoleosa]|uniref:Uncharacterized protein n=1 Tax=Camellia lanceoleosa TaxID=1840588 RepID=A0ACC0GZQ9_9ERIC|nr:hypothetical protein LOK49_LG07G01685 [Camellia lanceoleosa]
MSGGNSQGYVVSNDSFCCSSNDLIQIDLALHGVLFLCDEYNVYEGVQARKGSMLLAFGFLVPQGDYIELHRKRHGYRHDHFKRKHKKDACKVHKRSQLAQKKDLVIYEMNVRAFVADESSGQDPSIHGSYLGFIEMMLKLIWCNSLLG